MSWHLIEVLLPLADNEGRPFPDALLEDIKQVLVDRFGGVTAFTQAPAEGVWASDDDGKRRDEIVTLEVMADELDKRWWRTFRKDLERKLQQEEVVVRAFPMVKLTG